MAEKKYLEKVQVIFTVLTPVILGFGGFYINKTQQDINSSISRLQQSISSVEAMKPYFDMLTGTDPARAKMAAYALYMLNKNDPDMVVNLVLAADRKDLTQVLAILGKKDPRISHIVSQAVLTKEGESTKQAPTSSMEAAAKQYFQSATTAVSGWTYLGTFVDGKWTAKTIKIGNMLPKAGSTYEISDEVYVRDDKPAFPFYKLGKVLGVFKVGDKIKIKKLDESVGYNRVWAQVELVAQ